MTTAHLALETEKSLSKWIHDFAHEQVEKWFRSCDQVLEASHERCFTRQPSAGEERQAITALKYFLRSGRLLMAQAVDPDFPDLAMKAGIEIRLLQIEEGLDCLQNPISPKEADKLLAELFPE